MVIGCTPITGLEFDLFNTSIAKILGGTTILKCSVIFACFVLLCFEAATNSQDLSLTGLT